MAQNSNLKRMKHKILKLSTVILLFAFISTGCQKDEQIPNPEVDFIFQLLDDNSESKIIFNEGENFSFYFKIETNDTIWKFYRLVNDDPNFFRVYRIEDENYVDVGIPFKSKWCLTIKNLCGYENPFIFKLPWETGMGETIIPDQSIFPPFCLFNETSLLPKGKYITYFDEEIEFVRCENLHNLNPGQYFYSTELMHFEIEFEIK